MKKTFTIVITLLTFSLFTNGVFAQCDDNDKISITIDNASFESWASEGEFDDPTGDFWDTTNGIVNLNPDDYEPNVTKSTNAHSGEFSAKLTTSTIGLITSASLFSGVFDPNADNPLESVTFGKPFSERPEYFSVWYEYEPIEGDSAEIYCYLEKGEDNETRIGTAYALIKEATNGWTELILPFDYESSDMPESISIIFASSAAGDTFQGQVGNTLYVDDVELFSCPVSNEDLLSETFSAKVFPSPAIGDNIQFEFNQESDAILNIFSVDGKRVFSADINSDNFQLGIADWNNGLYQYVINDKKSHKAIARGSFIVQ